MAATQVKQLGKESRDKLKKLLPMLASNQPGEVVAAAAAIGRTLEHNGNDFHDLAATLTKKPKAEPTPTTFSNGQVVVLWKELQQAKADIRTMVAANKDLRSKYDALIKKKDVKIGKIVARTAFVTVFIMLVLKSYW